MEDDAGELVATFAAVELEQDAPAIALVVDEPEEVERLHQPPDLLERAGEPGRAVVGLEHAGEPCRAHDAELQRSREAQQIVPVLDDKLDVDPVGGELVEDAVVGLGVGPPEPRAANVGDARAEL